MGYRSSVFASGVLAAGLLGLLSGVAVAQPVSSIKIGVLNDQSGVYADFGGKGSVAAAELAIEAFRDQLPGVTIELVSADHQNKPDVGSNIARQWYDTEGVDFITELTSSSVALAVQQITREKKRINIAVGPATARLTGDSCSPYGFHWAFDTRALAVTTGAELVKSGADTWYFITADYAFGHQLEKDTAQVVEASGGKVLGAVRHPLNTADFSSFLVQAQGSGAKIVALANAGQDTTNAIKQAAEFGIVGGGQQLAGMLITLAEVHALGLESAQGLALAESFYWDRNDRSRAFAARFEEKTGRKPNMIQAGTYSAVLSYLKAVKATGSKDADAVAKAIREAPVDDDFATGKVLANGRFIHEMHLFLVKSPGESSGPWDYYKYIGSTPGEKAYATVEESGCKVEW